MDPISIALAATGLIKSFADSASAKKAAAAGTAAQRENIAQQQQALAFQQQNLVNALAAARAGQGEARPFLEEASRTQRERTRQAGAVRYDQLGNATYYDPDQGRWTTLYTPEQQALISGGQARQRRAQARGAQAAEDYEKLRAGYLYRPPKEEAESYAEIVNLINQAQGTGERQLSTLMNRFGTRTRGNIPQLTQLDTGPSPGQQLAETMLKARSAALSERGTRLEQHRGQYLPGMKQFEETANYLSPVDPTGKDIVRMQEAGAGDLMNALDAYAKQQTGRAGTEAGFGKVLADVYKAGGTGVGSAYTNIGRAYGTLGSAQAGETKAATSGPDVSDFVKIASLLQEKPKTAAQLKAEGLLTSGTLGGTRGAKVGDGSEIGSWDRRFSFGPTTRGAGGEAAPFGGASYADLLAARAAAEEASTPAAQVAERFGQWQF